MIRKNNGKKESENEKNVEGDEDSKNADELAVKCTYRIADWCWRGFCRLTLPPAMQ
jgi:hypothetical protein